ncbi:MAG: F0F1 ATP synthase subunit gamma, partial [Gammaproteobacteria bacterium]
MHQLHEIRNIMDAMKNLAVLETHKLNKLLDNQNTLIEDLDKIAEDFLSFYSYPFSSDDKAIDCWILFGSERGFNGDFNEALIEYLDRHLKGIDNTNYLLVPIGNKLFSRLRGNTRVSDFIEGPDVAEEVNSILNTLLTHINVLQSKYSAI